MIYIIGFIFISTLGTLFHFVYDKTNHNPIVGIFAAVNESTWEHIKMALSASIIWSIIDGYFLGSNSNYFIAKAISLLTIMIVIPLIFYGYKSITKKPILFIDISTFLIAIGLSQYLTYLILELKPFKYIYSYLAFISLLFILGIYILGTMFPLKNFIFKDPITKKYGIAGHYHEKAFKK